MCKSSRVSFYDAWADPIWSSYRLSRGLPETSPPSQMKKRVQEQSGMTGKGGYREWGVRNKIWKQTNNWGIQPSQEQSWLWCHLRREMGWKESVHQTDLTRHHQILEKGDKFESSFLRLDRCFLALLRVDNTLVASFVEWFEVAFGWICHPGGNCKLV